MLAQFRGGHILAHDAWILTLAKTLSHLTIVLPSIIHVLALLLLV